MCVVSMISDYGRRNIWPQLPPVPWVPNVSPKPDNGGGAIDLIAAQAEEIARLKKELKKYAKFKESLEAAKKLDAAADQADCPDPEKAKWLESLDQRMKLIEEALGLL